ncbi:hypothetical protein E2C01_016142 [Portunus trituberculatus]|uniref:Uncharacterized protein n=1 Tax=Portunus trituberculatus TaxID=210409 RepID=A0A5B7DPZ8_PORTR|nr:hypothetical protein [Portunus trituberculatus]
MIQCRYFSTPVNKHASSSITIRDAPDMAHVTGTYAFEAHDSKFGYAEVTENLTFPP